jgi:hypothetical protein
MDLLVVQILEAVVELEVIMVQQTDTEMEDKVALVS